MRGLFLLTFLSFLPLVAGQASEPLMTDAQGDVALMGTPIPGVDHSDLRTAVISETDDALNVQLTVQSRMEPASAGTTYRLNLLWGAIEYRMLAVEQLSGISTSVSINSELQSRPSADQEFTFVADLTATWSGNTLSLEVPKALLINEIGAKPGLGSQLMGLVAETETPVAPSGPVVGDRMPNADSAVYTVQLGLQQQGDVTLSSSDPYRLSNGEATTFVYSVQALNAGGQSHSVKFTATEVPQGWNVDFIVDQLNLPAGGVVTIPVIVSIPFFHAHGASQGFLVSAETGSPNDQAVVQLGVTYTSPAQPAGHHPHLYLHSKAGQQELPDQPAVQSLAGFYGPRGYINTNPEDEASIEKPVAGQPGLRDLVDSNIGYEWQFPLEPSLGMGLDFNTNAQANLLFTVDSIVSTDTGSLQAELRLRDPAGNITALLAGEAIDVSALPFQADMALVPTPGSDTVPYVRGQNLELWIRFETDRIGTIEQASQGPRPVIQPGGEMSLPLFEFVRPLEADIHNSNLTIAIDPNNVALAPSSTRNIPFEINSNKAGSYVVKFLGASKDLVVAGPATVEVKGGIGKGAFQIQAPVEDQEQVAVYLAIVHEGDVDYRAVAPFVVRSDAALPPETASAPPQAKQSPNVGMEFLLALAACVLVASRRRR